MRHSRDPHASNSFRLLTLGGAALVGEGGAVVVEQRRRLALLVLVAMRRERGMSRDALMACLSPDSPLESARHSLHQLIYYVRQQLEQDAFAGTDPLRLNPAVVACDAWEFEDALDAGSLADAVTLYRGPFLDGFHLGDSTEFEDWAAAERSRLAARHADALVRIAEAADTAGEARAAIAAWRRLANLDPLNGRAALGLMRALAAAGDREGAIRHARTHEALVLSEVGAAADAEVAEFAAELRCGEHRPTTRPEPVVVAPLREERAESASVTASVLRAGPAGTELPLEQPPRRLDSRRYNRTILLAAGAGASITLALAAVLARPVAVAAPPDPGLVVVAPFRVSAADTSLAYLSQGAADLLAAAFTGEGGPRAVDPRLVHALWNRSGAPSSDPTDSGAARLTASLGAARLVQGAVVARDGRVELRASMLSVPAGRVRVEAVVRGPIDSLSEVVERLAGKLLVADAGLAEPGIGSDVPLAAVRAYLDGRATLRRGDWTAAVAHLDRALTIDSTFASAALALRQASAGTDGRHAPRAESIAWRYRDRLGERERLLFVTELGPNYPAWFPYADKERAWRALLASDWANGAAWRQLGTLYHFHGARLDMAKSSEEARIALERALEFDSLGGTPTRDQLLDIAAVTGNVALLKRALARAQPADSTVAELAYLRWLRAFTARDSGALDVAHEGFSRFGPPQLKRVWSISQRAGFDLRAAEAALEHLARTDSDDQRAWVASMQYNLALNRGRPTEAQAAAGGLTPEWRPLSRLSLQVLAALYGDGDRAAGASAARALESELGKPLARDLAERRSQLIHACIAEQWRLTHHDMRSVDRTIAMLRSPEPGAPGWAISFYESCAAILESWRAAIERRPDAWRLAQRTDSLMRSGTSWHWALPEHRLVARIWELVGDPTRALTAVRRRRSDSVTHLAADLREEGRLAVRAADTAGAVRAFRHYLVLRFDPEPMLRPDRDRVRAVMARLQAAQGGAAP